MNDRYFFKEKLSEEELKKMAQDPMVGLDMGEIMASAAKTAATDVAGQALAASAR